jgi:dolichol-phosphate mannosyltransferase
VKKMRVLCALPTYNEGDNIAGLIRELLALPLEVDVVVVDDSSPDGTAAKARAAGEVARAGSPAAPARVRVIERPGKGGLGSAQRTGMAAGVAGGYDRVVVMDADGSHAPERVPALVAATDEFDVAIGARYIPGGGVQNWAWYRLLLSRGANVMARLVLGRAVHDWTSSFRCYRTDMLARLPLDAFRSDGYAFAEEMLFECRFRGYRTVEVPILFVERRAGRSKIDRREVLSAVYRLFAMGLRRLRPAPGGKRDGSAPA